MDTNIRMLPHSIWFLSLGKVFRIYVLMFMLFVACPRCPTGSNTQYEFMYYLDGVFRTYCTCKTISLQSRQTLRGEPSSFSRATLRDDIMLHRRDARCVLDIRGIRAQGLIEAIESYSGSKGYSN